MSDVSIVVLAVGLVTIVFKAAGPVFLGCRPLPRRVQSVVDLLAPAMLTALVVTQTLGSGTGVSLDARVLGVTAAGFAAWRGLPLVGAMVIAAAVTALLRAIS